MKRLVIATDGSKAGRTAFEDGIELARGLDARVLFVFVQATSPGLLGERFYQRNLSREAAEG
jgi:nucleotide-binding universal stress UspA family protein